MTPETLLRMAAVIREEDAELMAAKNHDYAGDSDALENLRGFGFLGIIIRLEDKWTRLKNFAKRRVAGSSDLLAVKDESIRDTLRDIRNYATLAEIMLDEEEARDDGS